MATPGNARERLFNAAAELTDPGQRAAFLDAACSHDPSLRAEIEDLLRHDDAAAGFLSTPAPSPDATSDAGATVPPSLEPTASRIGPYKLLQLIGEGGMGTVWMAEQTTPVKRIVALKFIKAGLDSRQVLARFDAERQALALMDHPNIAKVLDAGATEQGRPYFVMELVKGIPITRFCDEKHLTPRERLELFIPICQAVQHAHQKGIIHRDIKPSNVVVGLYDGKPIPKIIDFGVAKATGPKLTEATLFTGFGTVIGTPEYMSPEQAQLDNLDIDTRSDIYSLGVLLYELLTGTTPFTRKDLEKAGILEMLRVIREQEPTKPSTKLSTAESLPTLAANRGIEPAKLKKLVRGELDWIVMKALEKDRNRRYETANAFAMDVQRYLADEPVLACPPSAGYRLRKFARRNLGRLAVAALVLCFLMLLGSGVGWVVRDRSARDAEAARQQRERQAKVAGEVESIFGEVEHLEKEQKWPEALAAAKRAEAAVAGGEADDAIQRRVGERLKDLAFIDRLEQIRMEGATIVVGTQFDYAGVVREYPRAFRDYGVDIEVLPVETVIDRLKARPALAIPLAAALDDWVGARQVVARKAASAWMRLIAVARAIDTDSLRDRVRAASGQPVTPELQANLRRLAESIDVRMLQPATLYRLAVTLRRARLPEVALRIEQEAQHAHAGDFWVNHLLAMHCHDRKDYEGAVRFYTAAISTRPNSVAAHNNLGIALSDQKKLDEAIVCHNKPIELDPKLAGSHDSLGSALRKQQKLPEAIAAHRKAIELDPNYATAHNNLGVALLDQKKLDEAIVCYNKAIELNPKFFLAYANLGVARRHQGKLPEAIEAYRKAIEINPNDARAYYGLGVLQCDDLKDYDKAVEYFRKSVELDPRDAHAHYNFGCALRGKGQLDEAITAYRKAIELDPEHVGAHCNIGDVLRQKGRFDEAIVEGQKAIELDPKDADAHNTLGNTLVSKGSVDEAIAEYRKAIALSPKETDFHSGLILALKRQGRVDETIVEYRKAIALSPKEAGFHSGLIHALQRLGRVDEAIAERKRLIELNPNNPAEHYELGNALKAKGDLDGAVVAYRAATAAIEKKNPPDANSLYNAACYRALIAAAQAQARGPDAARLTKDEADRAMAWLTKAVAAGFADFALMDKDTDLDSLRDREDFRKLWADVQSVADARSSILRSQWDQAAAAYAKSDLLGRALCDDAFAWACLFLIRGDSEGYDRFCQGMIRRAGRTKDHFEAFVLARTCAMARQSPVDPSRAVQWANQALASDQPAWYFHALGLAQYRAGQFDHALQSFAKANGKAWAYRELNWFGLALVHHRLGHPDEARQYLDKGVQWLKRYGPPGPGRPAKIYPIDWLEAQVLRREAEEMLNIKQSP
jgi:tetratricopeptide (TPR) repeat protein/tRNA A-37 threonylcarbamoyl transferase component Bud32